MKKIVFVVCVCLAAVLSATVCRRCRGAKTIEQKAECPVCSGRGYTAGIFDPVMCPRCSKGGISTVTIKIHGKNRRIGPGVIKELVACPDCDGSGKGEAKVAAPEKPEVQMGVKEEGALTTIRMKRSSVKKLLEDGEIKSKKYHFILVDD